MAAGAMANEFLTQLQDWMAVSTAERPWLVCPESDCFEPKLTAAIAEIRKSIRETGGNRIAIAESNPVDFLAWFSAAVAFDCAVFLCNPLWGDREWGQTFQIVRPHTCLGTGLPRDWRDRYPIAGPQITPTQIAIPTGGTTGHLRFASHSWKTLLASARGFQQHFQPTDAPPLCIHSMCLLPLFHVSGLMQFVRAIASQGSLFIGSSKQFLNGEYCALHPNNTFVSLVPTHLQRALQSPKLVRWLRHCRAILLGGAPAWTSLLARARDLQLPLALTYGTTETAAQVATLKPEEFLVGRESCAQLLPHVSLKILDDLDRTLPVNTPGRIAISSPALATGYYPDRFSQTHDRFWSPDDIGYFDSDGYLHVLGRNSDKILTGGETVFPLEVETAIRATGAVLDIAVTGIPDPDWGEAIAAVFVPKGDRHVRDIRNYLKGQLAPYKVPKYWRAVDTLPRNNRGKVDRRQLRSLALAAQKPNLRNL